ncbi:MAG: CRISPR system precrRNA processing endoribonuclease RAMP protein Cas6 [Desulfurococcales archaeon]|nr:CRISPR system precrRNA processing endoribonuclease RAMP protein Cas6 [Desulfurococcales archaeon]
MPLYRSMFEDVKGVAVRVLLGVEFIEDTLLPPFTSKLLKSLLLKAECLEPYRSLYIKHRSFRPVTLRVLRTESGRRLYRVEGGGRVLRARRGEVLLGEVDAIYKGPDPFNLLAKCSREEVDIGFTRVAVWLRGAEVYTLSDLGLRETGVYRLRIHTPLLITTKIMAPRTAKGSKLGRLLRSTEEAYRLLPTPGYILAQAMRQWVAMVRGEEADLSSAVYSIGRLGDLLVAELDYRLRPLTVVYGKDDKGVRRVRGVTGYLILRALNKSIVTAMSKLLAFSSLIGLGKSRSIGFGEVEAEPLEAGNR